MLTEEYCWAITRVARWLWSGRSGSSVLGSGLHIDIPTNKKFGLRWTFWNVILRESPLFLCEQRDGLRDMTKSTFAFCDCVDNTSVYLETKWYTKRCH